MAQAAGGCLERFRLFSESRNRSIYLFLRNSGRKTAAHFCWNCSNRRQLNRKGPAMNTANLQLQGLLLAVASINNALVRKGLLSIDEIDLALRKAEASLTGEERLFEDMSPANRDAICFPIRLLQLANSSQRESSIPGFSELTRMVGQTKDHYNDQM